MRNILNIVIILITSGCVSSVADFDNRFIILDEKEKVQKENEYKFWKYSTGEIGEKYIFFVKKESSYREIFSKQMERGELNIYLSSPSKKYGSYGFWPIILPLPIPYMPRYDNYGKEYKFLNVDVYFLFKDDKYRRSNPYEIEDVYVEDGNKKYLPKIKGRNYIFDVKYKNMKEATLVLKIKEDDWIIEEMRLKIVKKTSSNYSWFLTTI